MGSVFKALYVPWSSSNTLPFILVVFPVHNNYGYSLVRCEDDSILVPPEFCQCLDFLFGYDTSGLLVMRSPSPIMDHHNTTGHEVSLDNFTIVAREDNNIARNIREAIFIRVNNPSLNRNIGKFQLPHSWDEVLARSPELHLK